MKVIAWFFSKFYFIKNKKIRRFLRAIISKFDGGQAFSKILRHVMKKYEGFDIGIGSYGPCFDSTMFWVGRGNLVVGNYCSIASNVTAYSRNHPIHFVSTSPLFYNSAFNKDLFEDKVEYSKLVIGNDVWIGQNVVILPSCKSIGNGAVIGAGSIITKDIPPYSVVCGNPGKIIKKRFTDEEIDCLNRIQWWNWDYKFIKKNCDAFSSIDGIVSLEEKIKK